MNFDKNSISRKRKELTSASTMVGKRAGVSFLRVLFLSLVALTVILICLGIGAFKGIIDNTPDISEVNIVPSGYATFIYDAEGNQIQKLTGKEANRMSVSISDIPENMQHAIVAIEDERFYKHNGIDIRGIVRAFAKGITNGFQFTQGGSTITQQLLKNNVFTDWMNEGQIDRFKRKFQEWYLALQLESYLTAQGENAKDVILENYLNTINFGSGNYGIQAAAQGYFGKDAKDLTLSECATLAAIPQAPTKWNPKNYPENNVTRRKDVLDEMLDQGYISQEEYDEAMADSEDVYKRIQEYASTETEVNIYSYFIDATIEQAAQDLMDQKGYTEVQAYNALYSGGLRIYTTQDQNIQRIMDEEYANPDNFPNGLEFSLDWALTVDKADGEVVNYSREMMRKYFRETTDPEFDFLFDSEEEAVAAVDAYKAAILEEGDSIRAERISFAPQPQSSMTVIDQKTGYVKGIVGGRGEKTANLALNRATDSPRQPGSTFKILSTYGPALDYANKTLATTYVDEPYKYENGRPVHNWQNSYHGNTTIRYAIEQSINVVAVKCFTEITPRVGFNYLLDLGFKHLVDQEVINGQVFSDVQQPTALGGLTYGVTNLELTAAYAAIANKGVYTEPIFYTKILDKDGNVIIDNTPKTTTVFKESTAFLLTSAMEDVVTKGTGRNLQLSNMTVAGKTGTTNSSTDLWFAGFTPYYTCSVWAGYDSDETLPNTGTYRSYHQTLWHNVMERIHAGLEDPGFEPPSSVKQATVCSESGLLAGKGCKSITEYFDQSNVPKTRCTQHYVAPTPTPTPSATPAPETDENGNQLTKPTPEPTKAPDKEPEQPPKPDEGNDTEDGED